MTLETLRIKQLSSTGELLGVVSCHAGQISVFRANATSDLAPYVRALAGVSAQERFSLTLDDGPYSPGAHNLIGYGERFSKSDSASSPEEFLRSSGAPESSIGASLSGVGLDAVSTKPLSSLSSCEERRLRLLAATFQPEKVLVLNDPFDPISSQWRERFAELLTSFARTKNALIVVPLLSHRPENWIDNELVARIQVGQSLQKTIGFGSAPSEIRGVLDKIRSEQSQIDAGPVTEPEIETSDDPSSVLLKDEENAGGVRRTLRNELAVGLGLFGGLVLLGIVGAQFFLKGSGTQESSTLASSSTALPSEGLSTSEVSSAEGSAGQAGETPETVSANQASLQALPTEPRVSEPPLQDPQPQEPEPVRVAKLLDLYPAPIRASIIESFEGTASMGADSQAQTSPRLSRDVQAESAQRSGSPRGSASEILTVLESTSSPSSTEPQAAPPVNPSEAELETMSPEQRREVIRQRFLEAIQRAAQPR